MRRKYAKIKAISLILMFTTLTTGCSLSSLFTRNREYDDENTDVITVTNVKDLEDNAFYVLHGDNTYYQLYFGETSFNRNTDIPWTADSSRVAWFGTDYSKIPTMHKGDKLVYHSTSEFSDTFTIERYEDLGYTIGICNMSATGTGRYSFSTNSENMQIDIYASTGGLYQLGDHTATMERIGDIDLRKGNISRAGTIIGLKHGMTYATDIYIGTNVLKYNFVADVRAMASMDVANTNEYKYTQDSTITIEIPEYFNSGYYNFGNYGIVRYIDSDEEFNESMDMNIPNVDVSEETNQGDAGGADTSEKEIVNDVKTARFTLENSENIIITVTCHEDENITGPSVRKTAPTAKVIGDYAVYTLSPEDENGFVLTGQFQLPSGDYRIEVTGLAGRTYTYKVVKKEGSEESGNGPAKAEGNTQEESQEGATLSTAEKIAQEEAKEGTQDNAR